MRAVRLLAAGIVLAGCLLPACASIEDDAIVAESESDLTSGQRRTRAERIRDVARGRGLTNGVLLAGIAQVETGLAQCWSDATWACKGPHSSTCNGPVLAGAGDGPCGARAGGLGMFQFDGGNYDQTLARDGRGILDLDGNISRAVDFVTNMVRRQFGIGSDAAALAWMNDIQVANGNPRFEEWKRTLACRYNGACGSASQAAKYGNATIQLLNEMGAGFWRSGAQDATGGEGSQAYLTPSQQHFVSRDPAGNVRHRFWDANSGQIGRDTWGEGIAGRPVAFVTGSQQHVFARGNGGGLEHWFWDANGGGGVAHDTWGQGLAGDPAAIVIGNGQHVWAAAGDGSLRHWWWDGQLRNDTWSSGVTGRPSAMVDGDAQHVFVRGTGGALEHYWWQPDGLRHDTWAQGLAGDPAARLVGRAQHVWAIDGGGALQHWWWDPNVGGISHDTWGNGVTGRPSVMLHGDGQHVFARGVGGSVEHFWWQPDGLRHDTWGGGIAEDPTAILIGDGRHVFAPAADGNVLHWWWTAGGGMAHDSWGN